MKYKNGIAISHIVGCSTVTKLNDDRSDIKGKKQYTIIEHEVVWSKRHYYWDYNKGHVIALPDVRIFVQQNMDGYPKV